MGLEGGISSSSSLEDIAILAFMELIILIDWDSPNNDSSTTFTEASEFLWEFSKVCLSQIEDEIEDLGFELKTSLKNDCYVTGGQTGS